MNIRIIRASAGTGKTTRLSRVLDEAIAAGTARPEAIIATTFTRQASAELVERARSRLLASGRGRQAHQLLAARIGTVNAVCGGLVSDFAFELGLSPALRVLDESSAELEQKRAIAAVVDADLADELGSFRERFEQDLDWHQEVRKLIEAARANGLDGPALATSAARSIETLDTALGACEPDGAAIDTALLAALDGALAAIDTTVDTTKGTAKYLDDLRDARRALSSSRLRWGEWSKLTSAKPTSKSMDASLPVALAAARHATHPRLRDDLHRFIQLLFQVAASGLEAYRAHKHERGVIDFVDQEALALQLLRRADVRDALAGQLDLVLVDEFQDTSPLQLAIFLELASLARESVWVGDQKQAIYGFRGTDPALMDAVIDSLTATTNDPELVDTAVANITGGKRVTPVETLDKSYRSRPALVALTNEVFARAFVHHGMSEDHTRLEPNSTSEPEGLGPIVEHWPLLHEGRVSKQKFASACAAGVRDLLASQPAIRVRDADPPASRTARPGDLAVLCRTNDLCQLVADALAELGIPAVVPRMHLLDTAEGQLVVAALRLWVDPRDALAAAELARLVTYATDLDALVTAALSTPNAFATDPTVAAILAARTSSPDLGPVAALDAVIDAAKLRTLCAAWGNTPQRHANLDALRAHATTYVDETIASRDAPSLVGLLAYFDAMTDDWSWKSSRTDRQALVGGADAVTVSTWHAAKGREWPLVVLFGLESVRDPAAFGLHVESDAHRFDIAAPLAGRWLRYWPNPYTTYNMGGPIKDAYERSPQFEAATNRAQRELLRLAYVGWTRARDRLLLAAGAGKLTSGLFGTLVHLVPDAIVEPPSDRTVDLQTTWASRPLTLRVRPTSAVPPAPLPPDPGEVTVGRSPQPYPPARLRPSDAPAIPCVLCEPIAIGSRLSLHGAPDMEMIGRAVHGFLAVDHRELARDQRLMVAEGLLRRYGVIAHLDAEDVVQAGTSLWTWLADHLNATRVHREWPIAHQLANGTKVAGAVDLVARTPAGLAIVDHKTFPGTLAKALERVPEYSGQLAAYRAAIAAATNEVVRSMWIHLPVLGIVIEAQVPTCREP